MRANGFGSVLPMVLLVLAGCDASNREKALPQLHLSSEAFGAGQPIPAQYGCDGGDRAPPLHWSDPPAGTKSFALVVDDPDAPGGTFHHWGVFDVPPSARSIGGGHGAAPEVRNDFGTAGYKGPCPPKGNGLHHYDFKLFALDIAALPLPPSSTAAEVESAARRHAIAAGELIGTYQRK